ncbi:MAG: replicative DNA helicase [Desulfatiglandales bacterium]
MKPLPHDIEAERAVLCAMMIRFEIIPQVKSVLLPGDFYKEAHKHTSRAMFETRSGDLVILGDFLKKEGLLEKAGGMACLGNLVDAVSTSAGWPYHADIIKKHSIRRRIIVECQKTLDACYDRTSENDQVLSDHKGRLRRIESDQAKDFEESKALIGKVFDDIQTRKDQGGSLVGAPTGFENLDEPTGGLEPKTTTYLIARPSVGKTTLALNIAENMARAEGKRVLLFSLESSALAITRRRLSAESRVFLSLIRSGDVEDSQWSDLIGGAETLSKSGLLVLDTPKFKFIERLTSLCESMALEHDLSLIVIDHIQLMKTRARTTSRHELLSSVSERLQDLAKDLNVPVMVLCQLNRKLEDRPVSRQAPQLSDMKESGDLEQNADNVWGLWRQDKTSEYMQIEGLKGRDTGTFKTWLKFDRYIQKFYDCEEQYQARVKSWNGRGYDG